MEQTRTRARPGKQTRHKLPQTPTDCLQAAWQEAQRATRPAVERGDMKEISVILAAELKKATNTLREEAIKDIQASEALAHQRREYGRGHRMQIVLLEVFKLNSARRTLGLE